MPSDSPVNDIATARALIAELVGHVRGTGRHDLVADADVDRSLVIANAALIALDAVTDTKCNLDKKPPAEIRTRPTGPDGELVMRCDHDPSHCWTFTGMPMRCP